MDDIAQLVYRYCLAFDSGDIEGAVACFTDDGILVPPAAEAQRSDGRPHDPAFRAGGKPIAGREAIRQYMTGARGRRAERGWQPRHLVNNLLILDQSETEATVHSYVTFVVTAADGSTFIDHAGVMIEKMVKQGSAWKFREHRIRIDADQNFPGRPAESPRTAGAAGAKH
jgi:3-phenylpropionate/cinnamic acid dioxygenase small subunit